MTIKFTANEEFFTFHDPMQEGKLIDRKTEIRKDPLTGETSRIIFDPGAPFTPTDYTELAKKQRAINVHSVLKMCNSFTPTFPESLIAGGRLVTAKQSFFQTCSHTVNTMQLFACRSALCEAR